MSKVYQLLEQYYDDHGYVDLHHLVWEMYQNGEIDEHEYEVMKDDEDANYDLQSLANDRKAQIEIEWELESSSLERWYRNNV